MKRILVNALGEGAAALPDDLDRLAGCQALLSQLLREQANECEQDWDLELAAARQIETIHALELLVAEKAARLPATSPAMLLSKLAIWEALEDDPDAGEDERMRGRLIQSMRVDLERMILDNTAQRLSPSEGL